MIGRWLCPLTFGTAAHVEHVPRRILEGPHAALAQHHVRIALRQDVLRRHQQVLDRRAHAALQQHRLLGLADFLEQIEVLHVAGADLEHVGVAFDQRHLARVHHLGDDRHVVLVADVAQNLQALLAQSLETVRAGARLEGAAAQDVRPGFLDLPGDLVENLRAFDGARPGDHRQRAAADLHLADGRPRCPSC